jgi:hypothetical protein
MSDADPFDIHDYGVREGLFHCTREPHEVLGHCHDYRCDFIRQAWTTYRARISTLEARIAELTATSARLDLEIEWFERLIEEDGARGCDVDLYRSLLHKLRQVRGDIPSRAPSREGMARFFADEWWKPVVEAAEEARDAARAERDEAVGLLREAPGSAVENDWERRRRALLARLAAAPEKETSP